jgi:hypothetical protein
LTQDRNVRCEEEIINNDVLESGRGLLHVTKRLKGLRKTSAAAEIRSADPRIRISRVTAKLTCSICFGEITYMIAQVWTTRFLELRVKSKNNSFPFLA